jgi:hypothetical protein
VLVDRVNRLCTHEQLYMLQLSTRTDLTYELNLGESLVTMPSALVREIWDEKWQLSRPGPLYLNLFLEIYF